MNTKISLILAAAVVGLAACGDKSSEPAAQSPETQAQVAETPEQVATRIKAQLGPKDFALRQVQCMETVAYAKRAGESRIPADLLAEANAIPRNSFLKLVREARDAGAESEEITASQKVRFESPNTPSEITPDFVTDLKECMAISQAFEARNPSDS